MLVLGGLARQPNELAESNPGCNHRGERETKVGAPPQNSVI